MKMYEFAQKGDCLAVSQSGFGVEGDAVHQRDTLKPCASN